MKNKATGYRIHIDEAGRWPLAGPVFVWLTMSLHQFDTSLYHDSKQLNESKRLRAYTQLQKDEENWHIICATGWASAAEIDRIGIIASIHKAICRWMFMLLKKYFTLYREQALLDSVHGEDTIAHHQLAYIFKYKRGGVHAVKTILHTENSHFTVLSCIIDGNTSFGIDTSLDIRTTTVIKWDSKNPLISAASILAKVERDEYMKRCAKKFNTYAFDAHKWYGTKQHRAAIEKHGVTSLHRKSFCRNLTTTKINTTKKPLRIPHKINTNYTIRTIAKNTSKQKPWLLLHICCAPDLSRPLHWLKHHFKLYLFWYNPNIHPRKEHDTRYASFIKLVWLEQWDYEIIEDWYDPKEFFAAMIEQREDIDPKLKHAASKTVLAQAWEMEERSSRCNPCYSMRLAEAARNAEKHNIAYFTSTLLISPKKKMDKLMRRWLEWERRHPQTKFLWFDFAKNGWYDKASKLTKKHWLFRQNYCGCGWTIPKPGDDTSNYSGG